MSTTNTWIHDSWFCFSTGNFILERARKLHGYASAEATTDDEHAVRRGAMGAQPIPRRACVDREARLAWRARRVAKAAIVWGEHVGTQARRICLVVLHAEPHNPCARRPMEEEDRWMRTKRCTDKVIARRSNGFWRRYVRSGDV